MGRKRKQIIEELSELTEAESSDLQNKKRISVLEAEVKKLKSENRHLLTTSYTMEEYLTEYKDRIKTVCFPKIVNAPKISTEKEDGKESILVLSDWHTGEVVKAEEINNINAASTEIILKRGDSIFHRFTKLSKTINVKNVRVYVLGDMVAGDIHHELERNQSENTVDTIIKLNKYLTLKLIELSSQFKKVKVIFLSGNHGRLKVGDGKPFQKQKQLLNFEFIMANMISENLKSYKNIECIVPRSPFHLDEVNSKHFLILHGDTLAGGSGSFAGIPYYGLAQSAAKLYGALQQSLKHNFTHIIMGHLHAFTAIPLFNGGKLIINSSLIGTSEYGLNKMKSIGSIEQAMLVVAKDGDIESIIRLIPEGNK